MFKRRRPYKQVFIVIVAMMLIGGILTFLDHKLRTVFFEIAEYKAVQIATEAMQLSLQKEATEQQVQYQDLINIHKDTQGRITIMQANTMKVNKIASSTTLAVQKSLEDLKRQTFSVPLGQVLGVPLFANHGPRLSYSIMPVGTVRYRLIDQFDSAGINQTRHTIYLNFDTNVRIVVPSKAGETVVSTQVPLTESIIVGDIPDTFVTITGGVLGNGFAEGIMK